jgi:hypothetical protein
METTGDRRALATEPIEAGPLVRAAILASFLAPSVVIVVAGTRELLAPEGAAPSAGLSLVPALFWAALMLRRGWRAMLVDLGRVLLARAAFPLLFACTLIGALVALSGAGGVLAQALVASIALTALAKALHLAEHDPARLKTQLALIAINLGLLAAADWPIRRFVLPRKSHNNIFTEHEPVLGWKLRPNASNARYNDLYVSHETVNALGFRTPLVPFEKPAGTRRVVVLGDSHSEAYTVDDRETWCAQLQQRLSTSDAPVEVISLGVGGYSTDQELLCYLHYGRRFDPDLVLLQTCSNDPEGNVQDHYWRGKKPLFERHGETLLLTGVPVPNLRNTGLLSHDFLKRSALLVLLESMLRQLAVDRDRDVAIDWDEAYRTTDLLIRDLASLVRADGVDFAAFNANTKDHPEFDQHLRESLARHGLSYLETDAMYVDPFESYWYAGHWNPKGQTAAAAMLAPQLARRLAGLPAFGARAESSKKDG